MWSRRRFQACTKSLTARRKASIEREKQRERRPRRAKEGRNAALAASTLSVWLLPGATVCGPG